MYLSTYESGLDDKRRMTIPAAFRAVLRDKSHDGVLIWKSFRGAYLEGAGMDYILKIKSALDELDPYDDAREAFEKCRAQGITGYYEHVAAGFELARLGKR